MKWLLVIVCACGGSSQPKQVDRPKLDDTPRVVYDCEQAANHLFSTVGTPVDQTFAQTFADHCRSESWGEDVRSCMGRATHWTDVQTCVDSLNNDQRKALGQDLAVKLRPES